MHSEPMAKGGTGTTILLGIVAFVLFVLLIAAIAVWLWLVFHASEFPFFHTVPSRPTRAQ
ncbi:MAG: hypothetical protein QOH55_1052 [Microbacteriaceae bacterium]|nr:hypothetical protein [Microbacteriaceae bacterium]